MASKQQTQQAWRIVSDPQAHEKQWLSACTALGPQAVHPSQSFKLPTAVQTTGSVLLSFYTSMGHFLYLYFLVVSMLIFFGMPMNILDAHWSVQLIFLLSVPTAAGVNVGLLDRGDSAVSKVSWAIPVLLMYGLIYWMNPANSTLPQMALWSIPSLGAAFAAYWCGRHWRHSVSKFSNSCRLGASSLACTSVFATLAWWVLWMAHTRPFRTTDPTFSTSEAVIGASMVAAPLFVSAVVGGVVCGSRRLKTGIGAGLLINFALIASCFIACIGAGVLGLTNFAVGTAGFQLMLAFAASLGLSVVTSAAGGALGSGVVRLKSHHARQLELKAAK